MYSHGRASMGGRERQYNTYQRGYDDYRADERDYDRGYDLPRPQTRGYRGLGSYDRPEYDYGPGYDYNYARDAYPEQRRSASRELTREADWRQDTYDDRYAGRSTPVNDSAHSRRRLSYDAAGYPADTPYHDSYGDGGSPVGGMRRHQQQRRRSITADYYGEDDYYYEGYSNSRDRRAPTAAASGGGGVGGGVARHSGSGGRTTPYDDGYGYDYPHDEYYSYEQYTAKKRHSGVASRGQQQQQHSGGDYDAYYDDRPADYDFYDRGVSGGGGGRGERGDPYGATSSSRGGRRLSGGHASREEYDYGAGGGGGVGGGRRERDYDRDRDRDRDRPVDSGGRRSLGGGGGGKGKSDRGACAYCFQPLSARFQENFYGQKTCNVHTNEPTDCLDCGKVVSEDTPLCGGRVQCDDCNRDLVLEMSQVEEIKSEVMKVYEAHGLKRIHQLVFPAQLVSQAELNQETFKGTNGPAARGGKCGAVTVAVQRGGKWTIQAVKLPKGCSKDRMAMLIAHELIHCYMYRWNFPFADMDEQVQEGLCELGVALYMQSQAMAPSYEFWLDQMQNGEDPVYNEGYRQARQSYDTSKVMNAKNKTAFLDLLLFVQTNASLPLRKSSSATF